MPEPAKTTFENVNNLLGVTLWPLIILIIFFTYRVTLGKIIALIPEKLASSTKISVGSLSFEIEKTARISGNKELGEIIKNLSEKGIRRLLTLGSGTYSIMVRSQFREGDKSESSYTIPKDFNVLLELEKNGLIESDEPLDKFFTYFNSLSPNKKEVYLSKDGSTTYDTPRDPLDEKITELSIPSSKLSQADFNRVDRIGVKLTESGQKAFDIIVRVISEQIKKE